MLQSIKRVSRKRLNSILSSAGLELVKKTHNWDDTRQFIPFQETLDGARAAGLSVGDYIDSKHSIPGATQNTHDRIVELGVFVEPIARICEI
jgi:hypothetical protein